MRDWSNWNPHVFIILCLIHFPKRFICYLNLMNFQSISWAINQLFQQFSAIDKSSDLGRFGSFCPSFSHLNCVFDGLHFLGSGQTKKKQTPVKNEEKKCFFFNFCTYTRTHLLNIIYTQSSKFVISSKCLGNFH